MFPSIRDLAKYLAAVKSDLRGMFPQEWRNDESYDVRLQVTDNGWSVHTGDSSYDQDHRGYWGASCIGKGTNCREVAFDLIDQCREHKAQCQPCETASA